MYIHVILQHTCGVEVSPEQLKTITIYAERKIGDHVKLQGLITAKHSTLLYTRVSLKRISITVDINYSSAKS